MNLGRRSPTSWDAGFATCFFWGAGRGSKSRKIKIGREATAPLKGRAFKIEISKVSGSTLVAEICTDPHNRLLRRQHCSSLCSQSEGHEHVANMTNALGHNFVDFQLVLGRHNIRPPHFASKVSYSASPQASAKCSRDAPCSDAALACYLLKNEPKFSWILNTLPRTLPWATDLLDFQPAQGRRQGFFCIIFINLIFQF